MKRPPGAIPPLTKEGLQTLVGKCVRVPVNKGSPGNCWWLMITEIEFIAAGSDDVVLALEARFKNRHRVLLSECVFDEEDPLVASIRRERFLAKLKTQGTLS